MLDKKTALIFKIVMATAAIGSLVVGAFMGYYIFFAGEDVAMPYFLNHFGLPIILALIAVIAFCMPIVAHRKYQDDSRDSIMLIAALLLLLLAVLTIIMSYMGIGFYSSI
ncbi:MAG: hypothetical protein K6A63_02510 [Acholeplasmatales bacterium]|nr:hypothetical protein [Acholeplasmatales bacterium]